VSPSSSILARLRRRQGADEGFTLAEVITALMIFGVIAAALIPLLISATRLATIAKLGTQAKQLAVERVESMRNLPYYVAFDNGQYRDILDIYFRDLQAAGGLEVNDPCTARAYLAASSTYRCTISPIVGFTKFRQQIDVQFLTADRVVVVPRATYNARVTNQDVPQSSLLGVTVTTSWDAPGVVKSSVVRTEIANIAPADRQIVSAAGVTALKVASTLSSGQVAQLQAGMFNATGALSTAASAAHSTVGAQASYLSGTTVQGAAASASAPADEFPGLASTGIKRLNGVSCYPVCFGSTEVTGDVSAQVSGGVPVVSSNAAADQIAAGVLQRTDLPGFDIGGISYTNLSPTDLVDASLSLDTSKPMMFFRDTDASSDVVVQGSGFLLATRNPNPNTVRAYASGFTKRLRILPTTFAQDGVVRITLTSASIDCNNTGAGASTVSADWNASVSWWTPTGYSTPHILTKTSAPLPDPSSIEVVRDDSSTIGVNESRMLNHWIADWSGLHASSPIVESTGRLARGSMPAVVSITTRPTRGALNPASALGIEIGSLTCTAEDLR
jgi:prepilin-type N-terminal cleavage/methylation domain-containing protein